MEANGPDTHILAKQDGATWDLHPPTTPNPVLKYQYNGDTGQKNVEIEMICDQGQPGSLEAVGEMGTGFYQFKLTSKCACWNTCKGKLFYSIMKIFSYEFHQAKVLQVVVLVAFLLELSLL